MGTNPKDPYENWKFLLPEQSKSKKKKRAFTVWGTLLD